MGSLDDEEESDEARGGPTESEAKRGSHQEMRPRKRDEGEGGGGGKRGEGEGQKDWERKKRSGLKE